MMIKEDKIDIAKFIKESQAELLEMKNKPLKLDLSKEEAKELIAELEELRIRAEKLKADVNTETP